MQRIYKLYFESLWLHGEISRKPGRDSTNFTPYPSYEILTGRNDLSPTSAARTCQYGSGAEQSYVSSYQSVNKEHMEAQQDMG